MPSTVTPSPCPSPDHRPAPAPVAAPSPPLPASTRAVLALCTDLGLTATVRPGTGGRLLCLAGHSPTQPFGFLTLDHDGRVNGLQLFHDRQDPRLDPDPRRRRAARSTTFAATLTALNDCRPARRPVSPPADRRTDAHHGSRHAS